MKDIAVLGFLSMLMFLNFAGWSLLGSTGNVFRSGEEAASLVELYSSEGCSSCPPADAWMAGLGSARGLWTHFVPVAFHVDYWDYLGWKDPIASAAYSERQRDYARVWGRSGVYTPGVVVNGVEERNWSSYSPTPGAKVGALEIREISSGHYAVSFEPAKANGAWEAHVVLLGFGIVSRITAGENAGRTITHDFVVLNHTRASLSPNGKLFSTEVSLYKPQSSTHANRWGIAAWVTPAGHLKPEQAVGGYLR